MPAPERCAPASERRRDQLFATAAPAQRFVLVEQPGAWGRDALHDSRLGPAVVESLLARCREADARMLLIRRAHRDHDSARRWAVVDARPGWESSSWGTYADDGELLELDLEHPPGEPSLAPTFLVCTHGRRDACCARRGWPVTIALTSTYPDWTWQCSHVGGDRFAANLVILPHGLYYGRLTPESAIAVTGMHLSGRLTTDALRGRSCFSPVVQAAQHFARLEYLTDAIDDYRPLATRATADGDVEVQLTGDRDVIRVVVSHHESDPIERLTCSSIRPARVRTWELRGLSAMEA